MTTAIEQPATQANVPAAPPSPLPPPEAPDPPDPRIAVRAIFPHALASTTRLGGRWSITTPDLACVLGDGASEDAAWDDAAESIEQARGWGWGAQRRARGKGRTNRP